MGRCFLKYEKNVQHDTLSIKGDACWIWYTKFTLIKKNINFYPRGKNNCGDESIMVLLYDEHLGETVTERIESCKIL